MKVLFALSTDKVSDLIVQKYQQKYGELLDFKKVYFFDAILRELEKDTNYDSIIIDESLEGKFKDSDLVKKIATISTAAVKGDNTKIPLILILTPERVAGVPILYSLYNMGINNALLGTDRKFSKICELIVRPRNAKEAKEYYVIDAKDPDFEEQVVELVPEAQIINIKKFYKGLEKEKYSETFDKIARQYSDVELLYIIDKLPEEIKETLKTSNDKFNEIIKNSNSIQSKIREAKKEKLNTSVNIQNNEDDPFSNESLLRKQEYIQKINMNNNPQKFNQNVDNNSANKAENTINNVLSEEKQNQKQNQPQKQEEQVIEEKREELKEENKESTGIDNQNEQVNIYNNEKSEANENNKNNENNEFSKQAKTEVISEENTKKEELSEVDQEIENLKKELEQISLEEKQLEQPEESKIEESNNNNNYNYNYNNDFDNEQKNNHEALNDGIKEEKEESEEIQLGKEQEQEELIPNVQDNKLDDDIEIEFEEEKEEPKEVHLVKEEELKAEEKQKHEEVQKIKDNKVDDDIEIEFEEEKEEPKKVQLEKWQEPKQEVNNNNNNNGINSSNKQIQKPIRIDSINNDRVTEDIRDIGLEETDIKDFKSGIEKSKEEETNKKLEPSNNVIVSEKNSQQDQEQKEENKIDIEEIKNIGEIIPEEVNKKIKTNVENNNANINIDQNKPTNNVVENNKDNQNNNNNNAFNNQQNQNITTLNNQNNQNSQRHNMQNVHKNMNNNYNKVPNVGMHNNQNISANPNMKNIHNMNNMNSMRNLQAHNGYAPKENFDPKILEKYVNNKSAIFVGTSKSGVTFMINSLAMIFASIGINTAILDMTRNKNDYYMTTDNNEELRNIAAESINKLKHGIAEGIQLNRNLTMYTGTPFDNSCYGEAGKVLTTLYNNHTVVLIDADYSTPKEYFAYANNIFAIQTLDILTMQPLTHFMKELKKANILNDEKIKIIINKELPVKGLNKKLIIGGLSTYNSPTMSSMEQLFNRNTVNVFSVPFDIGVYQRYLTNIVECKLDITGYPKPFIEQLKLIANSIYTLENKGKEKIVIQNEFRPQGGPNMQNGMNNMGNMRRY